MTSSDISEIRARFEAAGQGHVFTFWNQLNEEEKRSLLSQLELLDVGHITKIATETLSKKKQESSSSDEDAKITGLPDDITGSIVDKNIHNHHEGNDDYKNWYESGLDLIAKNEVGVVLLAGGQGTRLGSSDPKGCYNVGLPSNKSLFQLQAERIIKLTKLAKQKHNIIEDCTIPWYIMTSGPTKDRTIEFFKSHNYFGLDPKNIFFFDQGVLPCLTLDGKIIMETPSKVALAPDGNGGIYNALNRSGVLDDIKKRSIKHIHTYCVDNSLVKVADPTFIGFSAQRKVDIATKVVRKRDATESVGLIVSKNNAPAVIEYSEISPELASAPDDVNPELLKLRAANIVNHYYSADFLLNIPNWTTSFLPFHVANKKIPFVNLETGELTKPQKPNGVKLEQFVFDVFPRLNFDKFAALEVDRAEEFSPLKNGPGSQVDCPETSRHDLLAQGKKWLHNAGVDINVDEVEVSPLTSYGGEGLDSIPSVDSNIV